MYNVRVKKFADSVQVQYYKCPVVAPELTNFNKWTGEIYERRSDGRVEAWNPFTEEWEWMKDRSDEKRFKKLLADSQNRSINVIYDLARSNFWEWFLTFTFSPEYSDRYNYGECSGKLSQWLRNMKKRFCPDMKYLVVPEHHKDGAWHFHGLFADCEGMEFEESGVKDKEGHMIYNVGRYNWGFTTAVKVYDTLGASLYLGKYVTKDLIAVTPGKKRYWCSRNCQRPIVEDFLFEGGMYELLNSLDADVKSIKKVKTLYNEVVYMEI